MMLRNIRLVALTILLSPAVALAAPKTFSELIYWAVGMIDLIIPTIITMMVVYYMYIGFNSTRTLDEGGGLAKRSQAFGWGILILFVAVSIWGILRILQNSLNAAGS